MIQVEKKSERKLWLKFEYNPYTVGTVKKIPSATYVPPDKGGPAWAISNTADAVAELLKLLGDQVFIPNSLKTEWKKNARRSKRLQDLSGADAAELKYLDDANPALYDFVTTRDYQTADIAFMAAADNCFNLNEPGTGKTVEAIATVFESVLDDGPVLVIAPLTALDATWLDSLDLWLPGMPGWGTHPAVRDTSYSTVPTDPEGNPVPQPQAVSAGPAGTDRRRVVGSALQRCLAGEPLWLIVNPECVRKNKDGVAPFPGIFEVDWNCVIIDEFHKMGVGEKSTLFSKSVRQLRTDKIMLMSGTPMGGKPSKLWAPLNLLYPDRFPGYWQFVDKWITVVEKGGFKTMSDVKPWLQDEFNEMLGEYMVRRQKKDIMKWLPEKQYVDVWVRLDGPQQKQYLEWEANSEIMIEEELVDAVSILAVYTRLRQFANCQQTVEGEGEDLKLVPHGHSAKYGMLVELLEELGINNPDGTEQVVIFSQFTQYINYLAKRLRKDKYDLRVITGETKQQERKPYVDEFQAGKVRVMLMNTNAGGVSITLDRADNVIFLDETWNPDDQEQAEDRCHRGVKTSQVTVYRILAKDTVDEYIKKGNITKDSINDRVLNARKKGKGHKP